MRRINWDLRLSVMNDELDRILKYIDLLEGVSKNESDKLSALIEEEMKDLSEEDRSWWPKEMHGSRIAETTQAIPQLMWYGAFVSLMSYLEHSMLYLARIHIAKVRHFAPTMLPPNLKPIKYTHDAVEYWKSVGFAFPDSGPLWDEIKALQDLRNQIAHEGGEQDGTPRSEKIAAYVAQRGVGHSLSIGPMTFASDESLILTAEFCREAVETVRKFFAGFVTLLPRLAERWRCT